MRKPSDIFIKNVTKLMEERKTYASKVAEAAEINTGTLSQALKEGSNPGLDTVAKIAKALGVEPWELLFDRPYVDHPDAQLGDIGALETRNAELESDLRIQEIANRTLLAQASTLRSQLNTLETQFKELSKIADSALRSEDSPELLALFNQLRKLAELDKNKLVYAAAALQTIESQTVEEFLKAQKAFVGRKA